jgi:hypothetical protein
VFTRVFLLPEVMQTEPQVPKEIVVLLTKWREGEMTPVDRTALLAECRKRSIPVHKYDFSNILVEGVSRRDASDWLLDLMRRKAFDLLRREFGATARFRTGPPTIDFFWRKAQLAIVISGPLNRRWLFSDGKMKRASKRDSRKGRPFGECSLLPNLAQPEEVRR